VLGPSSLGDLPRLRDARRRRASSHDTSGGNADFWMLDPGETRTLAAVEGPGSVRHIWMTLASREDAFPRRSVLRMYWDGSTTPCVEVPAGDFFGIGHGITKEFWSMPLTMSPQDGRGFNCYFPMPFASGARIDLTNDGERRLVAYFYIDYEEYDSPPEDVGRFHAQWRRQNPTDGWGRDHESFADDPEYRGEVWNTANQAGEGNYVILDARGRGHYVGCNLNVDCFQREKNDWYGEGDDMIFIDGDKTPTLHGTGTEDYFNTAWSPRQEFCSPYHGLPLTSGTEAWPYRGKHSMYRFHIEDPVHFRESIRVTIEHGHANNLSNDYSSTAYWYQTEPHLEFPPLPPPAERLPRGDPA
jgi:D-arabinan exo alpha-(1,3)/(1,5)-arabinofuranosidase (non-reducing end)